MAYKTLLLCLNETDRLNELIAAGRTLGSAFNAHVSGLYVIPATEIYLAPGFSHIPNVSDANRTHFLDQLEKVRMHFEDGMKDDGLPFDFRMIDSPHTSIATEQIACSHGADLIITSAVDRNTSSSVDYDSVERLVMAAGRPVLVLPRDGDVELGWDSVTIGWDESRQAARAVFDALPLLQLAQRVKVVTIATGLRGKVPGAVIAETLARHGIKVEVSTIQPDGMSTGEALQRAADDFGSGLLVLGAYGHSRLMEFIFGGVTRHMLKHITRPLLMSH
jgi:nucleotide-binding universal stress UspA family protein